MIYTVVNCGFNSCSLGNLKGSHCSVWQILPKKKGKQLLAFKSRARDLSAAQTMKFNHSTPLVASLPGTTHGHRTDFSRSPESSSSSKFKGIRSFRISRPTGKVLRCPHHDTAVGVHARVCARPLRSARPPSTSARKILGRPWRVDLLFPLFENKRHVPERRPGPPPGGSQASLPTAPFLLSGGPARLEARAVTPYFTVTVFKTPARLRPRSRLRAQSRRCLGTQASEGTR